MAQVEESWHWRNTMKPVRFFNFDGRAGFFLILLIVHLRLYTIIGVGLMFIFFYLLERKGLSFSASLRAIRVWFIGPYRPAWLFTRKRKMTDTEASQ